MPFTKAEIAQYLDNPKRCPFCKSGNITAQHDYAGDEDQAWQTVICEDCQKGWREYFKLFDIEELDEDGTAISNPFELERSV
jgi:hypothetical protein